MKRSQLAALAIALLTLTGPVVPAFGDDVGAAVIFATNSAWMKQNAEVISGNLVVNDASPGPYLADGKELTIGLGTTVPPGSVVQADSLKVKSSAVVRGDVFCNELDDGSETVTCFDLPLPVFATLPDFKVVEVDLSGAPDVVVPIGGFQTLAPGDYRDLKIKKNGTLVFLAPAPGEEPVWNVRSIEAGIATVLGFEAASEVRVEEKFECGQNSFVGPDGPGIDASDIVFYVAGINGTSGNLGATPKAAKLGLSSEVHANFYVPNGTLWLRQSSESTGAFLGRDVILGIGATATLDSGFFADQPPVADPQDAFTDGDQDLVVTLTASDPENGDLTFSIVGGLPQTLDNGTLLDDLTEAPFAPGTCSPSGDLCADLRDSTDCPAGETCVGDPSQLQSATVTYDPATGDDLADDFAFQVADPAGNVGIASVRINPGQCDDGSPPPCDPPTPPVGTVEAIPDSVETNRETEVTIGLLGEAPCDGDCDGEGADGDVPLTFSIVGGTPLTTANGGTVDGLVQGTGVPQRTASVTYTPPVGFLSPPADSFDFQTCGFIGAVEVCDTATVTVDVVRPVTLAEDQEATIEANTELAITLIGNPGGVGDEGKASPSRVLGELKAVGIAEALAVGSVTDTDLDGEGDEAAFSAVSLKAGADFEIPARGPTENNALDQVAEKTALTVDGGWVFFNDCAIGSPCPDGPFTFTTTGNACVSVTDAFLKSDEYEVFDFGQSLGTTSPGVPDDGNSQTDPDSAFADPEYSSGTFAVGTGSHSIDVQRTVGLPGLAAAFIRADSPGTSFCDLGEVSAGLDFPTTGERRFQVEFPAVDPAGLTSARVTLYTVKGADDTLDTFLFSGTAEQDGAITASDFEAPARELGVVMPVPAGPVGTQGTFTIDVLNALLDLFDDGGSLTVFSIQGRVDSQTTGQGLQVKTDPLPTLEFASPPPIPEPELNYTVLSLPAFGTLLDSAGQPVVVGQQLASPDLTFVSDGTSGSTSFSYQVEEFGIIGTGEIVIVIVDNCAAVGRPPGCAPDNP